MGRTSVSDNRLVRRAAEGDQEAAYALLLRHTGIVGWAIRERGLAPSGAPGLPSEDAEQAGLLGLWRAIKTYRPQGQDAGAPQAQFTTYAKRVVANAVEDACRSASTQRQRPLNSSISIDVPQNDGQGPHQMGAGESVESRALNELEFRADLGSLRTLLTPHEYLVLRAHLTGLTYAEVASTTGLSYKAVDGAMQRIRRKARMLGAE